MIFTSPICQRCWHHLWLRCQKQTHFKIRLLFRILNKKQLIFTSSHPQKNNYIISWFSYRFLENNEVVYRTREFFGAKSKSHDATTKKLGKEHHLRKRDILWNKWIYSINCPRNEFMQWLKKILKAGKMLVTTVQRGNQKTLYTAFCHNLHH
jgi:hypothetical protein